MTDLPAMQGADRWVRVSRGTLRRVTLIVAGLSGAIALAIAAPMSALGTLVLGVPVPSAVGWAAGTAVVFVLLGAVLLPRAGRALDVDVDGAALRLGRRVVPVSAVRHAYRIPDSVHDGRFQLRLAIPGGLDALVSVSPTPPVELTDQGLAALIRLVERSGIEPDVSVPARPPIGDELGVRDGTQRFADRLGTALLPFEVVSFSKAGLLAELANAQRGAAGAPAAHDVARDLGLQVPGTTHAPEIGATLREAATAEAGVTGKRGFFALQRASYRIALGETEAWLRSASAPVAAGHGALWGWGLAVVVLALVAPWLGAASILSVTVLLTTGLGPVMGFTAFALLTWPFFVWLGLVLMWRARVARFERARSAALLVRQRGGTVPETVARFFGPPFPERAFATGLYLMLIADVVLTLAGGLTVVAIGFGQVENWSGSFAAIWLGALMAASSVPLFFWALRIGTRAAADAVRSHVLWRAIAGELRS